MTPFLNGTKTCLTTNDSLGGESQVDRHAYKSQRAKTFPIRNIEEPFTRVEQGSLNGN